MPTGVPPKEEQPEAVPDLLAQIRGFSKSNLKKDAGDKGGSGARAGSKKKPPPAPSLMDQLKNKIGRRGAAMRAETPDKKKDDDDKIAMPGQPQGGMVSRKKQDSDSDDSDWEDDD